MQDTHRFVLLDSPCLCTHPNLASEEVLKWWLGMRVEGVYVN